MENHLKKMPSPLLSLVPILVLVALLFVTIRTFGSDALSGGSQVVLLTTTAVASLLAMIFCKVKWRDIEEAICKNILGVATAIIILLLIGALSGSWMNSSGYRSHLGFITGCKSSIRVSSLPLVA